MRKVTAPQIVCMLGDATKIVRAANGFLEQIARLLRQFVRVGGWIMLLVSLVGMLNYSHMTLGHLLTSGTGTLAILQAKMKLPHRRHRHTLPASDSDHSGSSLTCGSRAGRVNPCANQRGKSIQGI